jgi:membrane protease YdiL (CAAX protease family)
MIFSTKPNRNEALSGGIYLAFMLIFLPLLLKVFNSLTGNTLSAGKLNFLYYFINFAAILPIFRRFLLQSLKDALKVPFPTIWLALLGYLGNTALSEILTVLLLVLFPRFANINDLNIALMLQEDFSLIAFGIVVLVPVVEETLFRGMIFRNLYDRSPVGAYLVSMFAFAAVHVIGYIGRVEPVYIVLSFLQYLPAGYCLCFAYRRSGTIISPILMHMIVNAVAAFSMR